MKKSFALYLIPNAHLIALGTIMKYVPSLETKITQLVLSS